MTQSSVTVQHRPTRTRAVGLPRILLRWCFALAVLSISSSALWLTTDRLERLSDPRPVVLAGLALSEADLGRTQDGVSAATLMRWFEAAPELAPLLLRHALHSGLPPHTVRAIVESRLTPEQIEPFAGWLTLIELEHGSSQLPGRSRKLPQAFRVSDQPAFGPYSRSVQRLLDRSDSQAGTAGFGHSTTLFDRRGRALLHHTGIGAPRDHGLAPGVEPQLLPEVVVSSAETLQSAGLAARSNLDLNLSAEISRRLDRAIERLQSRAADGTVVILGAHDAELLAAVVGSASPTVRPDRLAHRGLSQQREPASIAKLITTSAAYRHGLDVDQELAAMTCTSALRLGSEILYCPSRKGALGGLDHAMASSCNVAFAELARRIGPRAVLEEYRRFGLVEGLPESTHLGFVPNGQLRERAFGDLAVGLNYVEITPLHAALLARTMVDGELRTPALLRARTSRLGWSRRTLTVETRAADALARSTGSAGTISGRVLTDEVLAPLQRSMRAVVRRGGTARGVAPAGMEVAMKTGTGRTTGEGYHVNYIGFTGDPRDPAPGDVAFSIRLVGGRSSRWVRREAKQLTAEILDLLQRRARSVETRPRPQLLAEATESRSVQGG